MSFFIIGGEYTNISNKEQFSLSLQAVKENLEVQKDFLGLYQLVNIKGESTVNAMKDALLRFNLQLETYDGGSNIGGKGLHCYENNSRVTKSTCCSLLQPFFKFRSKTTHFFVGSIRQQNGHSW